jgi:hypothetical protein
VGIGCMIGLHNWDGCKCAKCGKVRDEGHDWSQNCEKCARCGKAITSVHVWNGCKCVTCRNTRDEGHDWSQNCEKCALCDKERQDAHSWDGCECSDCRKTRDEGHNWNGCKCSKCGRTRDQGHEWKGTGERCATCGKLNPEILALKRVLDDNHDVNAVIQAIQSLGFCYAYARGQWYLFMNEEKRTEFQFATALYGQRDRHGERNVGHEFRYITDARVFIGLTHLAMYAKQAEDVVKLDLMVDGKKMY